MVDTISDEEREARQPRQRHYFTCSICGEEGWVFAPPLGMLDPGPPTTHASCANRVGYLKSAEDAEKRGDRVRAQWIRALLAELWPEETQPAEKGDQNRAITADLAGTWLDGAHGWHNHYRVVEMAEDYGFALDDDDRQILGLYRSRELDGTVALSTGEVCTYEDAAERLIGQRGLLDQATEHLQSLAPDGYAFVWEAGELFLTSDSDEL